MSSLAPSPLSENSRLVFGGESARPGQQISAGMAGRWQRALNRHGKPNSDVLRCFIHLDHRHRPIEQWRIDFPPDLDEAQARLYERPFRRLFSALGSHKGHWWVNDQANEAFRTAVSRLERYLITRIDAETPAWQWIQSDRLASAVTLVVARDDDFLHGVLQSSAFISWWRHWASRLAPIDRVASYPFPWPPARGLSSLSRVQEDHRLSVARTARTGDQTSVDLAVDAAYDWPAGLTEGEKLARLEKLNHQRSLAPFGFPP